MKAPKKSIKTMRKVVRGYKQAYDIDFKIEQDIRDMAADIKESIEKQTPSGPKIDKERRRLCGICGTWLKYRGDSNYCHWCGQKIGWNKETEQNEEFKRGL